MRTRQRKTLSLEVSTDQKAVLDRVVAALPAEPSEAPLRGASGLPALFYHPNCAARVLALTLSASFDALNDKGDNAVRKLDRAIQVFTLVDDDETGRAHLEKLKSEVENVAGFLGDTHGNVIPYLRKRMVEVEVPAPVAKPSTMPRAIGDDEEMPVERRRGGNRRPAPRREKPAIKEAESAPEPALEEAQDAPEAAPAAADEVEPADVGPTEAEAAAAAAAALAAMEAPYEEVVQDSAPRRFDPDRDLEPTDSGRRRRRRSRRPEGLERTRTSDEDGDPGDTPSSPVADAKPSQVDSADTEAQESPVHRASRSGPADEVAEVALEVLRQALRTARKAGLDGRVRVEVSITAAGEGHNDGERRRRRRRRRPRND